MTLNVIDISRYQAGINLNAIGCDAVITGVTFGGIGVNPYAADELNATAAAGKLRGAYHIRAWGSWTPEQEAQHFLDAIAPFLDGRLLLALDWEECDLSDTGWALRWLNYIYTATGIRPWIYMSSSVTLQYDWSAVRAAGYGLWVAQYPYAACDGFQGINWTPPATSWPSIAAWQFVGTGGSVNGYTGLDLSIFYGDASAWLAYAAPNGSTEASSITPIQEAEVVTQDDINAITNAVEQRIFGHMIANHQLPGAPPDTFENWAGWMENRLAGHIHGVGNALLPIAQGIGDLKNRPAAAAPAIDVHALAAQIAAALNTNQAHDFLVAFRNALPAQ